MFAKVLIAARGEIALRIARTCERMGIATLAVHGEGEAAASHVAACDEAASIASASPHGLDPAALIAAAKQHGAEAIHPGAGELCQDVGFARAAREAGLVLVGPPSETLERCADRPSNQELARQAGIRPLPGCTLDTSSPETVLDRAREVGYPLLVRAEGARASESISVDSEDELPEALERCRNGSSVAHVHAELWLDRPRLLSVQLMADDRDPIALGDVEHSLELEGRALLEEMPAPALTGVRGDRKRFALRDAAVRIAKEAGLLGAAVAEFVLDTEGRLYFTALRAGLAIEHALVEMCTGLDLVEIQLLIAAGERLPAAVLQAQATGNAIEARIYAENAPNGTASGSPEITVLRWPMVAPGRLRIETDLAAGSRAPADSDPLVARVIAYGPTRHQAVLTLDRVLAEAMLEPLTTNLQFVREILGDESFRAGHFHNGFAARLLVELKTRTSA
jgi:acetyl-CoA carboxylase biotin carboxylase subunit/3-methylcrotonyl-CoA carboxylase alpha subunit